jgi:hypothetical protein
MLFRLVSLLVNDALLLDLGVDKNARGVVPFDRLVSFDGDFDRTAGSTREPLAEFMFWVKLELLEYRELSLWTLTMGECCCSS